MWEKTLEHLPYGYARMVVKTLVAYSPMLKHNMTCLLVGNWSASSVFVTNSYNGETRCPYFQLKPNFFQEVVVQCAAGRLEVLVGLGPEW